MLDLTQPGSALQRTSLVSRTDVLDKVGVLRTLPDDLHVTTEMVASYYEVPAETIRSMVNYKRTREELESDGYQVLSRAEFEGRLNVKLSSSASRIALFPRRAVLRVGMLLRDSDVARQVRDHLLNVEEKSVHGDRVDELFEANKQRHPDGIEYVSARMIANAEEVSWSTMYSRVVAARTRSRRGGPSFEDNFLRYDLPPSYLGKTGRPQADYWVTKKGLSQLVKRPSGLPVEAVLPPRAPLASHILKGLAQEIEPVPNADQSIKWPGMMKSAPIPGTIYALPVFSFKGELHVAVKPVCEELGVDFEVLREKLRRLSWARLIEAPATHFDGNRLATFAIPATVFDRWISGPYWTEVPRGKLEVYEAFRQRGGVALAAHLKSEASTAVPAWFERGLSATQMAMEAGVLTQGQAAQLTAEMIARLDLPD